MIGAQGRNRTTDTAIFSRMLYQLSYLGIPGTDRTCDLAQRRRPIKPTLRPASQATAAAEQPDVVAIHLPHRGKPPLRQSHANGRKP